MRLSPSRLASNLSIGIVLSMALVQAGAAMEVDGIDRDLHLRVTRVGAQRIDADGEHLVGDVEGFALSVSEQAAADQGLALVVAAPTARVTAPAPPSEFVTLLLSRPAAPAAGRSTAPSRGRAPPTV
jgi:hypothetical protein